MFNWKKKTKEFLLNETSRPSVGSYIQALSETLDSLRPRSLREKQRVDLAKQHIKEIRRYAKKLEEQVRMLEEQINVLEEGKEE